ncbi:hypothetical protein [uncultured Flavobacterium sp.]|uniref:hypothetical protein n=1 Tax=uncultured Flavobacterium sp. TaxID=165435 RepID=UPI003081AACA
MKKLITTFGCLTAIILMTSCTADSVEGPNTEALKKETKLSPSATTGDTTNNASKAADGVDDKDKAQG